MSVRDVPIRSRWLTTGETLRFFGFGDKRFLYALVKRGKIPPPKRLSRKCAMWDRLEIERAIEGSPVTVGTSAVPKGSPHTKKSP